MSDQHENASDSSEVTDEAAAQVRSTGAVKGPDPEVWGDPEERRQADIERGKVDVEDLINEQIREKLAAGEVPIVELEDGSIVKGPDPAQWPVSDEA